uniref:Hydrophobic seed protein domain-containing protein n=1 Tax=Leersia perrieri TaxID=77586 RepID=A0A0D9XIQ8_9ORYZ
MDARAAAVFFLVILVFQGNPSCAVESCIFNSGPLVTCMQDCVPGRCPSLSWQVQGWLV